MVRYYEVDGTKSQYGDLPFEYGTFVDARYVKALVPNDIGNRYIEALPVLPDNKSVAKMNFKAIPSYSQSEDKSDLQKLLEIRQLEELRIPLPSYYQVWTSVYTSMVESYRKRSEYKSTKKNIVNVIADDEIATDTKLISTGDSTVVGFNMIGESGCGKTSQIKIALDYYPKVIRHTNPDGSKTIQIPYLYIICPPHCNFKELYREIADELDKYLGNTDHQIRHDICGPTSRRVGEMLSKVNEYIERFAIGMIVFDEVQQINFTSQNENSFNALMAMANNTMVAIAMIGTDEAIAQIAKIKQVGRRFGIRIPCDAYTTNKDFLDQILLAIERYQWFGKQQKLSTDIKNEIIKESHGVIAYIVLIYMLICMDYVTATEKPEEINLKYVKNIINRYFGLMKETLNGTYLSKAEKDKELHIAREKLIAEMDESLERQQQKASEEIIKDQIDNFDEDIRYNDVLGRIRSIYDNDYAENTIKHQYDLFVKKHPDASAKEITKEISKKLVTGKTDRRSTAKVKTSESIKTDALTSFVKSFEGDPNDPFAE